MATSSNDYRMNGVWPCPGCEVNLLTTNHAAGCPRLPEKEAGGEKLSNPKDIIGSDKVPLSLVPGTTKAYLAIGHLEGMLKYGLVNWREAGVRASIYLDALERHMEKWKNGEWCDKDTKVPHLANAIACISILIDAYECGKLTDDRPKQAPVGETITRMGETVKHLKGLYGHCKPKHYVFDDTKPEAPPDLYDGVTEKRQEHNRQGLKQEVRSTHSPKGRYQASDAWSEVSRDSGAICESDIGSYDPNALSEWARNRDLRRDELLKSDEKFSPLGQLAHTVLRSADAGGDVQGTRPIDGTARSTTRDTSNVGSKTTTRKG